MSMTSARLLNTAPVRKGRGFAMQIPRAVARIGASPADYRAAPPIIVNSLPKSGTHMLMQIAQALPGTRYFGSFIAQTPSLTLRMRSPAEIAGRIKRIVPGEVLGTHLYHHPETARALDEVNALHLFIYRDPRDVLLSETHYLTSMSRWHKMHKTFAAIPDGEERLRLAITGNGTETYPDARERIGAYMGWISDPSCIALSYETLNDPQALPAEIDRITAAFVDRGGRIEDPEAMRRSLIEAIAPEKSHTFNKGGIARWKKEMSPEAQAMCLERFPWLES
ncbi:hypothetical protein CSE45_5454 [Citreicella sp. SE45]|nr:hypothetical protein CSE45_5454 [Citreicella sp. SE45]